jgi:hypothetical protein
MFPKQEKEQILNKKVAMLSNSPTLNLLLISNQLKESDVKETIL